MIQASGTYTIAYNRESGTLIACEPDGTDMAAAISGVEDSAHVAFDHDLIAIKSGLILTDDPEERGDVVYRADDSLGSLSDVSGRMYDYAVALT